MGSLSYAVGGALAGAGAGIAQVGKESLDELKQQKLEDLRAQHQSQLATGLQEKGQEFQREMHGVEHGEAVAAAGAARGAQKELQSQKDVAALARVTERGRWLDRAARDRAGAGRPPRPIAPTPSGWTSQMHSYQDYDPKTRQQVTRNMPSFFNKNTRLVRSGDILTQVGDDGKPLIVADRQRAPPDLVDDVVKNPDHWPGFLRAYHYLPAAWGDSLTSSEGKARQDYEKANAAYNQRYGNAPPQGGGPTVEETQYMSEPEGGEEGDYGANGQRLSPEAEDRLNMPDQQTPLHQPSDNAPAG